MSSPTTPSGRDSRAMDDLLTRMTLAEKIGQMTQVEKNSLPASDVTACFIGSVLSGGGGNPSPNTAATWAAMVKEYQQAALQTRLAIPLIYGADAVHGHNNVHGATIFPHNIGLGAAGDEALVKAIGTATAEEMLATGVHWNFAPCVAVPQDIRWGRTYEGYGERTDLVSRLGAAYVTGLQSPEVDSGGSPRVLASVKHFVGDGGTSWGSSETYPWIVSEQPDFDHHFTIDQGITEIDEETLRAVHLPPYEAAIAAGALNIMVSFSRWNDLKMHAHRYLLSDVLKDELGFAGFLISDWMGINQLSENHYDCVVASINAGLDMIMVPFDYKRFIADLTTAVENGDVPLSRIDDAVRRILLAKQAIGLFDRPHGAPSLLPEFGGEDHRAIAREAVSKSLVLLKNEHDTLPISATCRSILVAGQAANDIGLQCGGWTIEWMGGSGNITFGTTMLQALRDSADPATTILHDPDGRLELEQKAPIGIVVLAEQPYAEGFGDSAELDLTDAGRHLLERVRRQCDRLAVILYSGRPLMVSGQLPQIDALVAAWLPGTEGQGLTDVLLGKIPFTGKLPITWPKETSLKSAPSARTAPADVLWPVGFGL